MAYKFLQDSRMGEQLLPHKNAQWYNSCIVPAYIGHIGHYKCRSYKGTVQQIECSVDNNILAGNAQMWLVVPRDNKKMVDNVYSLLHPIKKKNLNKYQVDKGISLVKVFQWDSNDLVGKATMGGLDSLFPKDTSKRVDIWCTLLEVLSQFY